MNYIRWIVIQVCFIILCTLLCSIAVIANAQVIFNIVAQSGKEYTAHTNLQAGDVVYTDRTYLYQSIPSQYLGLDYIRTSNDDKCSAGENFLLFDVSEPVNVYLAHDDRIESKPDWLETEWTNTNEVVLVGTEDIFTQWTSTVYEKAFPAGTVAIPGNDFPDCEYHCNYFVFVESLSVEPPSEITLIDISLAWNGSTGADGYRIFHRLEHELYNYAYPDWEGIELTCTIPDLDSGVEHYFVARAFNSYGESENSNEAIYTPEDLPPAGGNDISITVTW